MISSSLMKVIFKKGASESMRQYEYQFLEIPARKAGKTARGDAWRECRKVIAAEAQKGWRLKQVVVPFHEKMGIYGAWCYQIIFEREADQ